MRTEVFDAVQGVFDDYDLLVDPTRRRACRSTNADDGNTVGPSEIEGVAVDPLIGWCLTYFANFTGHPAASIPAGTGRRAAGRHADHRPPRRRRRRARGERRLRAPAAAGVPRLTYSQRSDSGSARIRSTRAGAPATTALSGTSLVTTDEVPTITLSPTVAPRRMQAP